MVKKMIAFGPVPSRRLGHSLGINNIPPKTCSYSCVYCQVGRTCNMRIERKEFYRPENTFEMVELKVRDAVASEESIDYLTFVPDGEPTLDIHLGREIELLRSLGIRIGVITNASLLWERNVRDDLCRADWVSIKIDAVSTDVWRKINRPHGSLKQRELLEGIVEFSTSFEGELVTETMLIDNINDEREEIERIADFIAKLKPGMSYLSIPTRPPAESWVRAPDEKEMAAACQIFHDRDLDVEYLIGYEGNEFAFTGNAREDLLSITSVHPMRKEGVEELLRKANADWRVMEGLLAEGRMIETTYMGNRYYLRRFSR